MADQHNDGNRTYHYSAKSIEHVNPYRNLAGMPLRQVEQLLLAGFSPDDAAAQAKAQTPFHPPQQNYSAQYWR